MSKNMGFLFSSCSETLHLSCTDVSDHTDLPVYYLQARLLHPPVFEFECDDKVVVWPHFGMEGGNVHPIETRL